MGIEQLKRWQWIVIGLLAGLALGYVWSGSDSVGETRNYNQLDFERDLMRRLPDGGDPIIRKVVLRPLITDYQGKQIQPVTFELARLGSQSGKIYWEPRQLFAPVPYEPMRFGGMMPTPQPGKQVTIADFLGELAKNTDKPVKFRYGWESERPVAMAMWTVGAVVIVGGLWPTFLNLLIGAGIARKPQPKKDEYDIDRFGKTTSVPEPEHYQPKQVGVSQEERDRLDDMNRKLEEQLKHAGVLTDGSAAEDEDPEGKILAPSVRKLDGGPLETAPAAKKADDDDEVEVKGEFYPVLIHHHKHKEEQGKEQRPAAQPAPPNNPA